MSKCKVLTHFVDIFLDHIGSKAFGSIDGSSVRPLYFVTLHPQRDLHTLRPEHLRSKNRSDAAEGNRDPCRETECKDNI